MKNLKTFESFISESINEKNTEEWQITFTSDINDDFPFTLRTFASKKEAEHFADDLEYDYQDIIIDDNHNDVWKTFYRYHNPEDKQTTYTGYDVKKIK